MPSYNLNQQLIQAAGPATDSLIPFFNTLEISSLFTPSLSFISFRINNSVSFIRPFTAFLVSTIFIRALSIATKYEGSQLNLDRLEDMGISLCLEIYFFRNGSISIVDNLFYKFILFGVNPYTFLY